MDNHSDIEVKYQKLATEYSKVRSQATVLKKAVLDEQAKSIQLNEIIRNHEQTIRKHDQEMESLTFRNEQLTKRIAVLQQDLQISSNSKKGKSNKGSESLQHINTSILDEELHKKIMENAQLLSSISDKEIEINNLKDQIENLEEKLVKHTSQLENKEKELKTKLDKVLREKDLLSNKLRELSLSKQVQEEHNHCGSQELAHWKAEADKWKSECELLRSKPSTNEQLTEYYESQLRDLLEAKAVAQSECKSLYADNRALTSRLEHIVVEKTELQNSLEKSCEELATTNENYKNQLDAMTEHLAAQNEKITKQCDEIHVLRQRLSTKKYQFGDDLGHVPSHQFREQWVNTKENLEVENMPIFQKNSWKKQLQNIGEEELYLGLWNSTTVPSRKALLFH